MRINQNIAAFNAYRNLSNTQGSQAKSLEKLSSGFRINRAADDASGLVNSENLRSQIGGLKVATRNAQDAISLVQTAEGAQTEVHSILQRMRDLAVQSANEGTNDTAALEANQSEMDELTSELNRIAGQTQYGTKKILGGTEVDTAAAVGVDAGEGLDELKAALLADTDLAEAGGWSEVADITNDVLKNTYVTASDGTTESLWDRAHEDDGTTFVDTTSAVDVLEAGETVTFAKSFTFQVGANANQTADVTVGAVSADILGVGDIDVADDAGGAITAIDSAIGRVSDNRAQLGAFQNRMESTIRNVGVAVENLSAAESRIRDTDMAQEMVNFTRSQILSQAGTAMLAQANQVPQGVLSLLR